MLVTSFAKISPLLWAVFSFFLMVSFAVQKLLRLLGPIGLFLWFFFFVIILGCGATEIREELRRKKKKREIKLE